MKKSAYACLLVTLLLLAGCLAEEKPHQKQNFIDVEFNYIGLIVDKPITVVKHLDNHNDFQGDGSSFSEFKFTADQQTALIHQINFNKRWIKITKQQKIDLASVGTGDLKIASFIENGYFFYRGRTDKKYSSGDLKKILHGEILEGSYTWALFDINNSRLYVYSFDS